MNHKFLNKRYEFFFTKSRNLTNLEKHAENFVHSAYEILSKNKDGLLDQASDINQFINHDEFIHCSMIAAFRLVENDLYDKYGFDHPTTIKLMELLMNEFSKHDPGFNDLIQYIVIFMQDSIQNNNFGSEFDSFQKVLGFWILYTLKEGELYFDNAGNIEIAAIVGNWISNLFDDYWENIPEY